MGSVSKSALVCDAELGLLQWPMHMGQIAELLSGHEKVSPPWSDAYSLLSRAAESGLLATVGTVDIPQSEIQNVVTVTIIGGPYTYRTPSELVPVPLVERDALADFLERYPAIPLPAYLEPLRRDSSAPAAPAPAPSPVPPDASPVEAPRRSEGDSSATEHAMRADAGRRYAEEQYEPVKRWYRTAEERARASWEAGSGLRHDQMATALMKDAPASMSRKTLLGRLKDVLKELGKSELIRGISRGK